jgi:DNA processing protein
LLKQGAKLVDSAVDILEEFRASKPSAVGPDPAAKAGRAGPADPVLAALGFDPVGLDALIARTGMGAAELSARLLELELAGRIARLPGQIFQRVERG